MDLVLLLAILSVAVFYDLRSFRIPNRLIAAGIILAALYGLVRQGFSGFMWALVRSAATILFFYFFYLFHILGAGDAKLFGVMGAFLSISDMIFCTISAFAAGAVIAVIHMLRNGSLIYYLNYFRMFMTGGFGHICTPLQRKGGYIHFSVPMLLACLLLCFHNWKGAG